MNGPAELHPRASPERQGGICSVTTNALSCVGRLQRSKASQDDWRSPNCFAFFPFFTFSFFYILDSLLSLQHPHSFPNTLPASRLITLPHYTSSFSSPLIIPGFRGAFGLIPRPFFAFTQVARPFHTFKPNSILVTHHQTPRSAIYAGVMASSDDDVPLRARKMKTNGVKQGRQSIHLPRSASLHSFSNTNINSLTLLFLNCYLSVPRLMPSP